MTDIGSSKVKCGICGSEYKINWEIVDVYTRDDRPMGESSDYICEGEARCPSCGHVIMADLFFTEYPVGSLEGSTSVVIHGEEDESDSTISQPAIDFYDL